MRTGVISLPIRSDLNHHLVHVDQKQSGMCNKNKREINIHETRVNNTIQNGTDGTTTQNGIESVIIFTFYIDSIEIVASMSRSNRLLQYGIQKDYCMCGI